MRSFNDTNTATKEIYRQYKYFMRFPAVCVNCCHRFECLTSHDLFCSGFAPRGDVEVVQYSSPKKAIEYRDPGGPVEVDLFPVTGKVSFRATCFGKKYLLVGTFDEAMPLENGKQIFKNVFISAVNMEGR